LYSLIKLVLHNPYSHHLNMADTVFTLLLSNVLNSRKNLQPVGYNMLNLLHLYPLMAFLLFVLL